MLIENISKHILQQTLDTANQLTINKDAIKFWQLKQLDVHGEKFSLHLIPNHKSMYQKNTRKVSWLAYRLFLDALFKCEPNAIVTLNCVKYNQTTYEENYIDPISAN